jgi:3-oxoadipate enol-lactonase
LNDCADDAAALCEQLGVNSVIACGYSMGGPVAQLLWRRHRDLVDGLVFAATSHSFIPGLQQRLVFAAAMGLMAGTTRTAQLARHLPSPIRSYLPKGIEGPSRPSSIQIWAAQEMRRHDMRLVLEAGTSIATYSARRWIGGVDVPTTVLVTTKDRAIPPTSQLHLALSIPDAAIHRYDEGHTSPMLESFGPAITEACRSVIRP